jgi:acyl-coenzyme A synthetase/AMP-(fatty) acid ligase
VHEIYGSTESGQLACRRTTDGPHWRLLPGVQLEQTHDTTLACEGHVEGRVPLSDIIELQGEGRFLLHGRHADLINIAGKRSSLAYLNHQLCAIPGVQDGAFFLPEAADAAADPSYGIIRLTAFVVAPGITPDALQRALRQRLDRVFLPRPLVLLDALPRNSTGKLPRTALQALYQERVGHGRT